jgi:hypothetical protein
MLIPDKYVCEIVATHAPRHSLATSSAVSFKHVEYTVQVRPGEGVFALRSGGLEGN